MLNESYDTRPEQLAVSNWREAYDIGQVRDCQLLVAICQLLVSNQRFFPGTIGAITICLRTGTIAPFEGSAAACARVSTSS
jgi:hypothetical protein